MSDKLTEIFEVFSNTNPEATPYQAFAAGLTAGAVSMRTRAIAVVTDTKISNDVKNGLLTKIGSLSDIPA